MAVFPAFNRSDILADLKAATPHAEVHIDDAVALKFSANGRAQDAIQGRILAYVP